jgi:hypothetical protein
MVDRHPCLAFCYCIVSYHSNGLENSFKITKRAERK